MKSDDAFICLMVSFPLLELMIRHELGIPDDQDVTLSENSPALHWFAKFMGIPDSYSRSVWDAFRNGLAHRAMIKGAVSYVLTGEKSERVAKVDNDVVTVYVWSFRDAVVTQLQKSHRRLWHSSSSPLPGIYKSG